MEASVFLGKICVHQYLNNDVCKPTALELSQNVFCLALVRIPLVLGATIQTIL